MPGLKKWSNEQFVLARVWLIPLGIRALFKVLKMNSTASNSVSLRSVPGQLAKYGEPSRNLETKQRWTSALFSRAISYVYHILLGVQRSVFLSFSVLFLSAISGVVYDLQLSLSFPWARFILLNTLDSVLTFIGIVRGR
jgi:hypothetical protein